MNTEKYRKMLSLYIHIPFCTSKCYYCDFVSYSNKDDSCISRYVDALCEEILKNSEILTERTISTIYFGGGTPSYLNSKHIVKILNILSLFNLSDECEITIEVNPNSLSEGKIKDYIMSGINRISIGLQSLNDNILKNIGRKHTLSDFIQVLELCKKYNLTNVSADIIYPLPGLELDEFKRNIDELVTISDKYDLKHISIYNLEIHEDTKLDFLLKEGFFKLTDEDNEYAMKSYMEDKLRRNGYTKYEISNFSKEGFESKHNINYWNQGEYLGFGVAASSFFAGTRYSNIVDINKYIDNINNNSSVILEEEHLDKYSLMKEYVILTLRLKEGINLQKFYNKFGIDLFEIFGVEVKELNNNGLITITDKNIYLTDRGTEVANLVWEKFI